MGIQSARSIFISRIFFYGLKNWLPFKPQILTLPPSSTSNRKPWFLPQRFTLVPSPPLHPPPPPFPLLGRELPTYPLASTDLELHGQLHGSGQVGSACVLTFGRDC